MDPSSGPLVGASTASRQRQTTSVFSPSNVSNTLTVSNTWGDWNDLIACLRQDLDEAGAAGGTAADGGPRAPADAAGTSGGAEDLQDIITKLRGYLEDAGPPPGRLAQSDAAPAALFTATPATDSTQLRRLLSPLSVPPPMPGAADFQEELSELVAAAQRCAWLSHVVRDHAHDLVAASSLRSFREREVLIDTHNRRHGTVFLVLDGELSLIFRAKGPDPGSAGAGTANSTDTAVLTCRSADTGSSSSASANNTARRSSHSYSAHSAQEEDFHEGLAVAGAGSLVGYTPGGLDSGGVTSRAPSTSSAPSTMAATLAQGLNFSYTLKAWGKKAGRVRCFDRRAVATCLVPLLTARRKQVMQGFGFGLAVAQVQFSLAVAHCSPQAGPASNHIIKCLSLASRGLPGPTCRCCPTSHMGMVFSGHTKCK
jgi:hypothetical protein